MGQETCLCFQAFPRLVSQLVGRCKGYAPKPKAGDVSFFVIVLLFYALAVCVFIYNIFMILKMNN